MARGKKRFGNFKWVVVLVSIAYIANIFAGMIELIPDVAPVIGNIDEAVIAIIGYEAFRE